MKLEIILYSTVHAPVKLKYTTEKNMVGVYQKQYYLVRQFQHGLADQATLRSGTKMVLEEALNLTLANSPP